MNTKLTVRLIYDTPSKISTTWVRQTKSCGPHQMAHNIFPSKQRVTTTTASSWVVLVGVWIRKKIRIWLGLSGLNLMEIDSWQGSTLNVLELFKSFALNTENITTRVFKWYIAKVQGVSRLVPQLWLPISSAYVDYMKYPLSHLII